MITQELKDRGIICKGRGLCCFQCKDKKECVDYVEPEKKNFDLIIKNNNGRTAIQNNPNLYKEAIIHNNYIVFEKLESQLCVSCTNYSYWADYDHFYTTQLGFALLLFAKKFFLEDKYDKYENKEYPFNLLLEYNDEIYLLKDFGDNDYTIMKYDKKKENLSNKMKYNSLIELIFENKIESINRSDLMDLAVNTPIGIIKYSDLIEWLIENNNISL